jgi:hypothetical protein
MASLNLYPESFEELRSYLTGRPRVRYEGALPDGTPIVERRLFIGYHEGGLWFRRPGGEPAFCPIACGMTSDATGVHYKPDHFAVTKFHHTVRYYYYYLD